MIYGDRRGRAEVEREREREGGGRTAEEGEPITPSKNMTPPPPHIARPLSSTCNMFG